MNAKQKGFSCFSHQFRFADLPALAVVGLLFTWTGPSQAALYTPSVGANIATNGLVGSWATQFTGPYITSLTRIDRTAGVWTDYGANKAGAFIKGSYGVYPGGYIQAESRWIDQLTVSTADAAPNALVHLRFSVRLDGHLEAYEDDYYYSGARVSYGMTLNHDGSWVIRPSYDKSIAPTPWTTAGGHVEADVDETLFGEIAIRNGHTFNLISELFVRDGAEFSGPPGLGWAESDFGNTAQWLGGSVWIGDTPASDCGITSGSGFDYCMRTPPTGVPEPGILALLGIGLACLGALRRFS